MSISIRTSPKSLSRRFGSLDRQRSRSRRIGTGVAAGRADQSGSRSRIFAIESDIVLPANATCPVSISYNTHPNAQMSVRSSTGWPRACSGLMYAAVPMTGPSPLPPSLAPGAFVGSGDEPSPPTVLARPKSRTFTTPSRVIVMLAGLRSRWTILLL